jgi:hypothetical protein
MNVEEKEQLVNNIIQITEKYLEQFVLNRCLNTPDMPVGRAIQEMEKTLNPIYVDF